MLVSLRSKSDAMVKKKTPSLKKLIREMLAMLGSLKGW